MDVNIHLGWWLAPALVNLICVILFFRPLESSSGGWYSFNGIELVFRFAFYLPITLLAWLIYFILN